MPSTRRVGGRHSWTLSSVDTPTSPCCSLCRKPVCWACLRGHLGDWGGEEARCFSCQNSPGSADVTFVDASGRSALHYACLHGQDKCIVALLRSGASVDQADANGKRPVDLAVETGYTEIVALLTQGPKYGGWSAGLQALEEVPDLASLAIAMTPVRPARAQLDGDDLDELDDADVADADRFSLGDGDDARADGGKGAARSAWTDPAEQSPLPSRPSSAVARVSQTPRRAEHASSLFSGPVPADVAELQALVAAMRSEHERIVARLIEELQEREEEQEELAHENEQFRLSTSRLNVSASGSLGGNVEPSGVPVSLSDSKGAHTTQCVRHVDLRCL
jgi:ankyrin repeat protein